MKVVSVVNQKGGCGKTITAVNLSAGLHKKGYRILLIDLDPQAHTTFSLRKENNLTAIPETTKNHAMPAFTITDILEKICQKEKLQGDITYTSVTDNFYLIPSSLGLASLEHKLSSQEHRLEILSLFLKKYAMDFDYVVLDCPPNLGLLTLNALSASTYALIPLGICDFSIRGLETLKNIIIMLKEFKSSIPTSFYFLNQVDKRSRFSRTFTERVRAQLGNLLLNTEIRSNIHIREAVSKGKNIFEYKPDSLGAHDFMSLADEIEKVTSRTNWTSLFLKKENLNEVYVVGDFNNWEKNENYKLRRIGEDIWSINLHLEKGKYQYKFVAKDIWINDPYNKSLTDDSFGGKNSLLLVE